MEGTILICLLIQAWILFSTGNSEQTITLWDFNDLAKLFNPRKPNFLEEGVRISEAKCNEYIWEVKHQEEVSNKMAKLNEMMPNTFVGIIGGRDADSGEFPHMGAVGWRATKEEDSRKYVFLCGSFLISDEFLVTAAHCYRTTENDKRVDNPVPEIVRLGVENIVNDQRPPQDILIKKFITHDQYKGPPSKNYDIALIQLQEKVIFSNYIRPACIVNRSERKAIVTGWGVVDRTVNSQKTSASLKAAHVDLVRSKKCRDMLRRKKIVVKKFQFCAYEANGIADTCNGDSGGPLQMKMKTNTKVPIYNVLGVTSFGTTCASKHFPSIYSNVTYFIDWIEENVWREERNIILENRNIANNHDLAHETTSTSIPQITSTSQYNVDIISNDLRKIVYQTN